MSGHILVIGATLLDVKGKPDSGLEPGTSNPGHIRRTRGGTARNVAENLGRLGLEVVLLTAVGDDDTGRYLLEPTFNEPFHRLRAQHKDGCGSIQET